MDFVHCSYLGKLSSDRCRFEGLGRYTFANGDVYLGGMQDGHFHGNGVIFFRNPPGGATAAGTAPIAARRSAREGKNSNAALKAFLNPDAPPSTSASPPTEAAATAAHAAEQPDREQELAILIGSGGGGGGQYRGVWEHGRHVEGHYVFQDGLVYGSSGTADMSAAAQTKRSTSWTYCHGSDRRLWEEYLQNVAPVLPHEALLGGARLLQARKHAMTAEQLAADDGELMGEGLPMVLPRAFVHARTAPAFAKGQLASIEDPRVVRWVSAATALEKASEAAGYPGQPPQSLVASPSSQRRSTLEGGNPENSKTQVAPAELIESTVALQCAMAVPTEGLRADGRLDDDGDANETIPSGEHAASLGIVPAAPQPALNLSVCRVLNVEDVNRALVQVVPAP